MVRALHLAAHCRTVRRCLPGTGAAGNMKPPQVHSEPLVTVLLPVHNAAPFLQAALDSILAQTFTDFELLAIDDGSTDGSSDL
ncbi:MAG: glycosyltransferase, partial [Flavobacteriales bacterium]|nr:glycosyltransferase [Flavobacteriales bacterium]